MSQPLVSVLMPAYNAQRWVVQSIESALAQDWPNVELIVVDDGSSDDTFRAASQYESGRVKVICQENQGAAAARNTALRLAQGDFVQWLDADDLLAPDKITLQMREARQQHPLVLFSSSFASFYHRPSKARFQPNPLWEDLAPARWLTRKFANNTWMNPAVWLMSRELSERAGGWSEELSLDDDGEYFARVVAHSRHVRFIADGRSYYRQWNPGSLSRGVSERACRSLLKSLRLSIGYLLELEDSPETRSAALDYLQVWTIYFYPDKPELLGRLQQLAGELGGQLDSPRLNRKYEPIRTLLGWKAAKTSMNWVAAAKLRAFSTWDGWLAKRETSSGTPSGA